MIFGNPRFILFCWALVLSGTASVGRASAEGVINPRDTLLYKDGDRIQGTVVSSNPEEIVFKSDRFGELRVKAADAVVIPAEKPEVVVPAPEVVAARPVSTPAEAAKRAEEVAQAVAVQAEVERMSIWDRFTPGLLTAKVRRIFGPWKGRFAFSTEIVSDSAERNNHSVEGRVTRKWEKNELQVNARYDYAEANGLPTADLIKASGSWRHDFSQQWFVHYRPSAEWNYASRRGGVPNNYRMIQQEFGAGYNVYTTPSRKVRAGLSQNYFDSWNTAPTPDHVSRVVQSAFEEVELKLPWQMAITQRGIWYPVGGEKHGWENRFEVNKKLTETLSTTVRHEIRRNNPDGSAQDYTRLRLMLGFDF